MKELLEKKIIQPSTSPWASPVVVVDKKDGNMRLCRLQRTECKDLPGCLSYATITDILESLKGAKVFSTLDLKSGYWQMEMEQSSVEKTAFWTASGLYEFLCLPFGLKNSAASFQRLMEHVLREHKNKFCMVYIDDIVVYSPSISTHIYIYRKCLPVFKKLVCLLYEEMQFHQDITDISRAHHLCRWSQMESGEISAVQSFPVPTSVKEVQRFLGLSGWYHRFIKNFSEKAAPLHALKKKGAKWIWSEECQRASETIKEDLISAPVLISPDFNRALKSRQMPVSMVRGSVNSRRRRTRRVVAYASRLLREQRKHTLPQKKSV